MSQPIKGDIAHVYRYSKVQAERAAWAFVEARDDKASFSLVTINPPMVVGRWLPGYSRLNDSCKVLQRMLDGSLEEVPDGGMGWIDVEDVARAHIHALKPHANGRYLVVSESHKWIDIAKMMAIRFPTAPIPTKKKIGESLKPEYDITRTVDDLAYKPSRTIQETLAHCVISMVQAGFLPKDMLSET
mmetsp:Transcript_1532/g.5029  ORF Transcript_1532/g.5029 Transcript_1532/m.5029 type:complete len:187 (+) Transcript_1532:2-562(+)